MSHRGIQAGQIQASLSIAHHKGKESTRKFNAHRVAVAGAIHGDKVTARRVGEGATSVEELLDGLDRPTETHDDQGLMTLGRRSVLVGDSANAPRSNASDQEDVPRVEEPGGAKSRQILNRARISVSTAIF